MDWSGIGVFVDRKATKIGKKDPKDYVVDFPEMSKSDNFLII